MNEPIKKERDGITDLIDTILDSESLISRDRLKLRVIRTAYIETSKLVDRLSDPSPLSALQEAVNKAAVKIKNADWFDIKGHGEFYCIPKDEFEIFRDTIAALEKAHNGGK